MDRGESAEAQSPGTEDSRSSEDSYVQNEEYNTSNNSYDSWGEDTPYDVPDTIDDDSTYESMRFCLENANNEEEEEEDEESMPPATNASVDDDGMEENNNDPNNNTDSIELVDGEEETSNDRMRENRIPAANRALSPQPGCSKDSVPPSSSDDSSDDPRKTYSNSTQILANQVLRLVGKITLITVMELLRKTPKIPLTELKLWDLLPDEEKIKVESMIREEKKNGNMVKLETSDDNSSVEPKKSSSPTDLSKNHATSGSSESSKNFRHAKRQHTELLSEKIPSVDGVSVKKSCSESPRGKKKKKHKSDKVISDVTCDELSRQRDLEAKAAVKVDPLLISERGLAQNIDNRESRISNGRRKTGTRENYDSSRQNPNKKICMEMFIKLKNIFPNVDPCYIKKLCPAEWSTDDRDAQLAPIVEHLLEDGDLWPLEFHELNGRVNSSEPAMNDKNIDDFSEYLIRMFPTAEPSCLRNFARKYVDKMEPIKIMIERTDQERDDSTMEMYFEILRNTKFYRAHECGFCVNQFLTIFPEPFQYFMDPTRNCSCSMTGLTFLKNYFKRIPEQTVWLKYEEQSYNLSITAQELEDFGHGPTTNNNLGPSPIKNDNVFLEIMFIKYKSLIRDHLESCRSADTAEYLICKEKNLFIKCQRCSDAECVPSKTTCCSKGHRFCNKCVIATSSTKIVDGETRIDCFVNCDGEFSLLALKRVLSPTIFSILIKNHRTISSEGGSEAKIEGFVSCPFCDFASLLPPEVDVFTCLDPICARRSCRFCGALKKSTLRECCDHAMNEQSTETRFSECSDCYNIDWTLLNAVAKRKSDGHLKNSIQGPVGSVTNQSE